MERRVLIPCPCGSIHSLPDPGRNVKMNCKRAGHEIVYECFGGNRYHLRGGGYDFPLEQAEMNIGRHSGNPIAVNEAGISRHHARLRRVGGDYEIEDLGSRNGTFVNEVPLPAHTPRRLVRGDLVRLDEIHFRYLVPNETVVDEAQVSVLGDELVPAPAPAGPGESGVTQEGLDEWIGRVCGAYEILALLNQGGMGRIYKARDLNSGRTIVLKTMTPDMSASDTAIQRFLREIEVAARIRHPNIVEYLGSGQERSVLYVAMEWFPGKTLREWFRRDTAAPDRAIAIGRQVAAAMKAAHAADVIHRDIKPHNVLMNPEGVVKVIDFGIAKAVVEETESVQLTIQGGIVGTPSYMAPEQFTDAANVGPAADVFSLGAVLYFCLTGRPPYQGETFVEVYSKMKEPCTPVRSLNPAVSESFAAALHKMLERDIENRYPSAEAVEAALAPLAVAPRSDQTTSVTQLPRFFRNTGDQDGRSTI